jgi:tellurite methyltransferase
MAKSIDFFDTQFQRQAQQGTGQLNPFELLALPYLRGDVLDFGCGMGNLSFAAAARGCNVTALDGSPAAVDHMRRRAAAEGLPVQAGLADLRRFRIERDYDSVAAIGLLMFFDCGTARRVLAELQSHVRPGGHVVVNVLVQGTTYLEMFEPEGHCLFSLEALHDAFRDWHIEHAEHSEFDAPGGTRKCFATLIARRPGAAHQAM